MSSAYETRDSEVVHDGFVRVRRDTVETPDGEVAEREVAVRDDAVGVVALRGGDVVLLRHYRHPHGRYLLEIPAGMLDKEGETREEAARRELAEETGLEAGALEELITFENSAGWTDESTTVFLARDVREGGRPDDFEPKHEEADLEIVRLPLDEAVARVRAGAITDAKTVIGLLLAADRGRGA